MATEEDKYFIDLNVDNSKGLTEMQKMTRSMQRLRDERKRVNKALKDGLITENQHARSLNRIQVGLKGLSGRYREASNAASGLTKQGIRFRDKIAGSMTTALTRLGGAMAGAFAISRIQQFVSKAVRLNAELSDSFADVQKTTGLTAEQVRELDSSLLELDTRTARAELLNLAQVAGRLNIEGTENIRQFVEDANQINVALGDVLGEDAALTIGKIAAGYREGILNIGSAINELGNTSRAQEDYIVEFLSRLQGSANAAGIAAADVAGFGATLDSFGPKVESSSTALSKFFLDFITNTSKFEQAAGIQEGALSTLIGREGTNEGFLFFIEALKDSTTSQEEFLQKMAEAGVTGKRASETFLTLAANIDEVRRNQQTANESIAQGTSVTAEYEVRNNNLAASMEKLNKQWNALFASGGTADAIQFVVDAAAQKLSDFKEIADETNIVFALFGTLMSQTSPQVEKVTEEVDKLAKAQSELIRQNLQAQNMALITQAQQGGGSEDPVGESILQSIRDRIEALKDERDQITENTGGRSEIRRLTIEIEKEQTKLNELLGKGAKATKDIEKETKKVKENIGGWSEEAQRYIDTQDSISDRSSIGTGFESETQADNFIDQAILDANLERWKRFQEQVTESEAQEMEKRRSMRQAAADLVTSIGSSIVASAQETAQRRLRVELDLLEKLRLNNEISQEEYARLAEQARRKEFESTKRLRIAEAVINGAAAIVNALNTPGPQAILQAALVGAQTAVQVATISAQTYARGGLLQGDSHEQGGIPVSVGGKRIVEAEGGEVIINKRSSAMYRDELSAINQAGGGVKFAQGGILPSMPKPNIGASSERIDYTRMAAAFASVNIETSVVDIVTGLNNRNKINQLKRL